MGKTYRNRKYQRDRFDGDAVMERLKFEGLLYSGRDQNGEWFGPDTRGKNQKLYDECVDFKKNDPWSCPCEKCGRRVKDIINQDWD